MADNSKYAQLQNFTLAGAGAVIGDTSVTLKSMKDIDGNAITMAGAFGTLGFGTLEPGNAILEEQISFTGITNNANGTSTLTGVKSVTFLYPYTATSGLLKTHAGSTNFIISNTSGFYDTFANKNDDETIVGTYTFPSADPTRAGVAVDTDTAVAGAFVTLGQLSRQAISGASNASTTVKGIVQIATQAQEDARTLIGSTSAQLVLSPGTQRSTLLSDYVIDTGSPNIITIAPSPSITSYQTGQIFSFKLANTNTSPVVTLNVNGKGAKNVVLSNQASPSVGDLATGQMIIVEYDGTNFQVQTPQSSLNPTGSILMFGGSAAPTGWLLCDGTSYLQSQYPSLFAILGTTYGSADGSHFNVPDMRGRTPVGVGTGTGGGASGTGLPAGGSALTARARGAWLGEETHQLSTAELAAHTHAIKQFANAPSTQPQLNAGSTGGTSATGTTESAGSDTAHNNIQPVMTLNFIIKH